MLQTSDYVTLCEILKIDEFVNLLKCEFCRKREFRQRN